MAQTIVSGIQPKGTIVYACDADEARMLPAYEEVVIASNDRIGKQVVHCKDASHPLYRIEYYPRALVNVPRRGLVYRTVGALTYKTLYTRREAMDFYRNLK